MISKNTTKLAAFIIEVKSKKIRYAIAFGIVLYQLIWFLQRFIF